MIFIEERIFTLKNVSKIYMTKIDKYYTKFFDFYNFLSFAQLIVI